MLDAHSDPQVPAAAALRRIILAGDLFAVLASNEGSVECMLPKRRPTAASKPAAAKKKKGVMLDQRLWTQNFGPITLDA